MNDLERQITQKLPDLQRLERIDEVTRRLAANGPTGNTELIYIVFPVLAPGLALDRIVDIAEQEHPGVFFIFISKEISASDYKRLVRSGGADWVSLEGAPHEILDIISRSHRLDRRTAGAERLRPAIAAFVPSGGGVGNATLAIETAVQIKTQKQTRDRRVCLLDLDLQTSHICDYLDIEPRLQMKEIVDNPGRLDQQLFELYVSQHTSSGIDVLATPRNRNANVNLDMAALNSLFEMISQRYDLVVVDLPSTWFDWTKQIISVCDLAIVSGLNNVPGLRQVAETLNIIRAVPQIPAEIVVVLNRCEFSVLGRIARRQHAIQVLGKEKLFFVRQDTASANHSLNIGAPATLAGSSGRISKDIGALVSVVAALKPTGVKVASAK